MTDKDDEVRYNVKMRKQLREDAKRNTERGELAQEVRNVFREKAYGHGARESVSELERKQAELSEVRDRIDDLRDERAKIEREIESQERRETRLEEQIQRLEQSQSEMQQSLDVLENMLQNGDRMWPVKIKNAVDVDRSTANKLYEELKDRNPDLPDKAFSEPGIHDSNGWKD